MILSVAENNNLIDSLLDAFPSGSYALAGLLRLMDVVESSAVPTAAVQCIAQPRMLINPGFVKDHAETPEKLLMLVMHELHHVLLGHTTLFPRLTLTQNFVFDAVINGLICRMFREPSHTAFLTDYYQDDRFPECLLRPPAGWHPEQNSDEFGPVPGLDTLQPAARDRAREIHAALYSEGGASYHEVYQLLPDLLDRSDPENRLAVPLLGGHGANDEHQALERVSPMMFDLVRETVEQWPQPPDPIKGRSLADLLRSSTVAPRRHLTRQKILQNLIRKVAGPQGRGRMRQVGQCDVAAHVAIPHFSRRSSVLQSLGVPVLLHEAPVAWRRTVYGSERVHVYLDVSGSMDVVLQALYGAVLDCEQLLWPRIHLFSTKIVDVTPAQLSSGRCCTTGGTSIEVVAEHLACQKIKRALIITDGWVGRPAGQHHQTLQDTHLAVAYLGNSINQRDLADVVKHSALLESGESS